MGFCSISILHMALGGLNSVMYDEGILMYVCAFLVSYMVTLGPIAWLYAAETQADVGLGFSAAVFMFFSFLTSTFKNLFIQVPCLHFLLGSFSVVAFIFVFFFVPETKNKSERLKKELFWPGAKYGRDLKPEE